jgi:hypothetical protein
MSKQLSVAVRNARLDAYETAIGTAPKFRIYTGAPPANCAAARTGTLIREITLPSDWMNAASTGSKTLLGSWTDSAAGLAGTAGHYAIMDTAGTNCHDQGTIAQNVVINTSSLTAANGNVLNFASTTGVAVGQNISGTGIVAGSTVLAFTGTTVTMSMSTTAGVASAASITFGGDFALDNVVIAQSQTITISSWTQTDGNA